MTAALGHWFLTNGVHIALVVMFAILATRAIRWGAARIGRRFAEADDRDPTVRSERVKHRQAVASVVASVAIGLLYIGVAVDIAGRLGLPVGSLVAPAAVIGAAL